MGNYSSQTTNDFLSSINSIIQSTAQSSVNLSKADCSSQSWAKFQQGSDTCQSSIIDSTVNVTANSISACKIQTKNLNTQSTSFTNKLIKNINNFIAQDAKNKAGFIATAINVGIQGLNSVTDIQSRTSQLINQASSNTCDDVSSGIATSTFIACGIIKGSNITVDADSRVSLIASCLNSNIQKALLKNTDIEKLIQKTDQQLTQTVKGVDSLFKYLVYIVIAIVVMIIIVIAIFFYAGGTTVLNTAAQNMPMFV